MLERLSQFLILTLSFVLAVVLLFLIFLWGNPAAFWHTAGELHDGFAGFLAALGMGIKILFFVALGLGGAAAVVKVNQSRKVQVISANKYGTRANGYDSTHGRTQTIYADEHCCCQRAQTHVDVYR